MTDVDARARECAHRLEVNRACQITGQHYQRPRVIIAAALTEHTADLQSKIAAAEARVAEVEAQAGELRLVMEENCCTLIYGSDDCYCCLWCGGSKDGGVYHKPECPLHESNTAGLALLARVKELEGEVAAIRKIAWLLIEIAGGEVRVSDIQLASVGPHDDCRIDSFADAWNRCNVLRSVPNYPTTTTG